MKLTDKQMKDVLKLLEINSTPSSELFKELNSDPDRVITEFFKSKVEVVFSDVEPILRSHTSRILSYDNRHHKEICFPEIQLWDNSREFLKKQMKVKNYSHLKYIVNQISFNIACEILDKDAPYELPNSIGTLTAIKSKYGGRINLLRDYIILQKVSKIKFVTKLKNKRHIFLQRKRYRLLAMYKVLNKKE